MKIKAHKDIDIVDEYGEKFYKNLVKNYEPRKTTKSITGGYIFYFSEKQIEKNKKKMDLIKIKSNKKIV
jgi:hypothetical protein